MPDQSSFEGWAVVEVMGHQRYCGHVNTESFGGAVLFRVDVPELPEEQANGYKHEAVQGYTKLIGAGSIYCITPCTEEAACAALRRSVGRPLRLLSLPPESPEADQEGVEDEVF